MKLHKTYESFVDVKNFKFEEEIIDPILKCIKDNLEFLIQPENLPQLAKLGYMYNQLWYAGRICWGYDGILRPKVKKKDKNDEYYQNSSCENNPKYKLEETSENGEINDLVYDAWGMHVSDETINFDKFYKIIIDGVELTPLEKKELKLNKTFDDWVEIKTDRKYKYKSLYPDRKSVANHLLCTIGNGYGWNKDGFVIEEASGADQDKALYGDWKNAKFEGDIKSVVDKIMSNKFVKETLDAAYEEINSRRKKRGEEDRNIHKSLFKDILKNINGKEDDDDNDGDDDLEKLKKLLKKLKGSKYDDEEEYRPYYPISGYSLIYAIGNKETQNRLGISSFDKSYIDASIEICKEIVDHEDKEEEDNVLFAKNLLYKYGFKEYEKFIPKEVDKYAILKELEDCLLYVTDEMERSDSTNVNSLKRNEYILHLNDSKNSEYADNNYTLYLSLKGMKLANNVSNNIDFLKSSRIYDSLLQSINRSRKITDIKEIITYFNNCKADQSSYAEIKFIVNDKKDHLSFIKKVESDFVEKGFSVGSNIVVFELKDYFVSMKKPDPLGLSHPNNKEMTSDVFGVGFFSTSKQVVFYSKSWSTVATFNIDERNINKIECSGSSGIKGEVKLAFKEFKESNPKYGTDIKEGKVPLYAHDFLIYLKNKGF